MEFVKEIVNHPKFDKWTLSKFSPNYGAGAFFYAIESDDMDFAKQIIEMDPYSSSPSRKSCRGRNALFFANNENMLKWLISIGIKKEMDYDHYLPVHAFAARGQINLLKFFPEDLDKKSNMVERDHTPLHFAILHGHQEVVKYLLDNGANPNAKHTYGSSCVLEDELRKSENHKPQIVEYLISAGAKLYEEAFCDTILFNENAETLRILLHTGKKIPRCALTASKKELLDVFLEEGYSLEDCFDCNSGGKVEIRILRSYGLSCIYMFNEIVSKRGTLYRYDDLKDLILVIPMSSAAGAEFYREEHQRCWDTCVARMLRRKSIPDSQTNEIFKFL